MPTDLSSIVNQTQMIRFPDGGIPYISDINIKIKGDRAVVSIANNNQLAVLVYCRSDGFWSLQASLASDNNSSFCSIDMVENTIAVGSSYGIDIFSQTNGSWIVQQHIANSTFGGSFGSSLAFSSDLSTLIVGASGTQQGSVYLFNKSDTTWVQNYQFSDGVINDQFGQTIAVSADGGCVLIGAPTYSDSQGCVYFFEKSDFIWTRTQVFAKDGQPSDLFGTALTLSEDGNTAVIGNYNSVNSNVYIFSNSDHNWIQQQKLSIATVSQGVPAVRFVNETILVSTPGYEANGRVSIFSNKNNMWTQNNQFSTDTSDLFGISVDMSGNDIVVGGLENIYFFQLFWFEFLLKKQAITVLQTIFNIYPTIPAYVHSPTPIHFSLQILNGSGSANVTATIEGVTTSVLLSDLASQSDRFITITAPSSAGTYLVTLTAQDPVYSGYTEVQTAYLTVFSIEHTVSTTPTNLYVNHPFSLKVAVQSTQNLPSDFSWQIVTSDSSEYYFNSDFIKGTTIFPVNAIQNTGITYINIYGLYNSNSDRCLVTQFPAYIKKFVSPTAGSHRDVQTGKKIELGIASAYLDEVYYLWSTVTNSDQFMSDAVVSDSIILSPSSYPTSVIPMGPATYTLVTTSTYYSDLVASDSVYIFAEYYEFSDVSIFPQPPLVPGCYVTVSWTVTSRAGEGHETVITVGDVSKTITNIGPSSSAYFRIPSIENSDFILNVTNTSLLTEISANQQIPLHTLDVTPLSDINISDIHPDIAFLAPYQIGTVCVWSIKSKKFSKNPFSDTSSSDSNRPIAPRSFSTNSLVNLTSFLTSRSINSVILLAHNLNYLCATNQTNVSLQAIDDAVWYLRRLGFCVNADMFFFAQLFIANSISPADLSAYPSLLKLYNNQFYLLNSSITTSDLPLHNCSPEPYSVLFTIDSMHTNFGFVGYKLQIPVTVTSPGASGQFDIHLTIGNSDYTYSLMGHQTTLIVDPITQPISDYTVIIRVADAYFSDCSDMVQYLPIRVRQPLVEFDRSAKTICENNVNLLTIYYPYSLVGETMGSWGGLFVNQIQGQWPFSTDNLGQYVLLVWDASIFTRSENLEVNTSPPSNISISNSLQLKITALAKQLQSQGRILLVDASVIYQTINFSGEVLIVHNNGQVTRSSYSIEIDLSPLAFDPNTFLSIVYCPSVDTPLLDFEGLTFVSIGNKDYIVQDYGKQQEYCCFANHLPLILNVRLRTVEKTGTCTLTVQFNNENLHYTGYNNSDFTITLPNPGISSDYQINVLFEERDAPTLLMDTAHFTVGVRQLIDFSSIDHSQINLGIAFVAMETYDNSAPFGAFGLRIKMADSDILYDAPLFTSAINTYGYNSDLLANNFKTFSDITSKIANTIINKGIQHIVFTSWSSDRIIDEGSDTILRNHIWIYEQLIAQLVASGACVHFDLSFFAWINSPLNQQMTYTAASGIDALSDVGIYFPNLQAVNANRQFIAGPQVTIAELKVLGNCGNTIPVHKCTVEIDSPSAIEIFPGYSFSVNWDVETQFGQNFSTATLEFYGQTYTSDYEEAQENYPLVAPQYHLSNVQTTVSSNFIACCFNWDSLYVPVSAAVFFSGSNHSINIEKPGYYEIFFPYISGVSSYVLNIFDVQQNLLISDTFPITAATLTYDFQYQTNRQFVDVLILKNDGPITEFFSQDGTVLNINDTTFNNSDCVLQKVTEPNCHGGSDLGWGAVTCVYSTGFSITRDRGANVTLFNNGSITINSAIDLTNVFKAANAYFTNDSNSNLTIVSAKGSIYINSDITVLGRITCVANNGKIVIGSDVTLQSTEDYIVLLGDVKNSGVLSAAKQVYFEETSADSDLQITTIDVTQYKVSNTMYPITSTPDVNGIFYSDNTLKIVTNKNIRIDSDIVLTTNLEIITPGWVSTKSVVAHAQNVTILAKQITTGTIDVSNSSSSAPYYGGSIALISNSSISTSDLMASGGGNGSNGTSYDNAAWYVSTSGSPGADATAESCSRGGFITLISGNDITTNNILSNGGGSGGAGGNFVNAYFGNRAMSGGNGGNSSASEAHGGTLVLVTNGNLVSNNIVLNGGGNGGRGGAVLNNSLAGNPDNWVSGGSGGNGGSDSMGGHLVVLTSGTITGELLCALGGGRAGKGGEAIGNRNVTFWYDRNNPGQAGITGQNGASGNITLVSNESIICDSLSVLDETGQNYGTIALSARDVIHLRQIVGSDSLISICAPGLPRLPETSDFIGLTVQNTLYHYASDSVSIPYSYCYPQIQFSDITLDQSVETSSILNVGFNFFENPLWDSTYTVSITFSDKTNKKLYTTSDGNGTIGIVTPDTPGVYPVILTAVPQNTTALSDTISFDVSVVGIHISNINAQSVLDRELIPITFDLTRTDSEVTHVTMQWDNPENGKSASSDYFSGSDLVITALAPNTGGIYGFSLIAGDVNTYAYPSRTFSGTVTVIGFDVKNIQCVQPASSSFNGVGSTKQLLYTNTTDFQMYFSVLLSGTLDQAMIMLDFDGKTYEKTVGNVSNQFFDPITTPPIPSDYPYTMTLKNSDGYSRQFSGVITVSQINVSTETSVYTTSGMQTNVSFVVEIINGDLNNEKVTFSFLGSDSIQSLTKTGSDVMSVVAPQIAGLYPYTITISNAQCSTSTSGTIVVIQAVVSDVHIPLMQLGTSVDISFNAISLYGSSDFVSTISVAGFDLITSDITSGLNTFTIGAPNLLSDAVNYPITIFLKDKTYPFVSTAFSDVVQVTNFIFGEILPNTIYILRDNNFSIPLNIKKVNNDDPRISLTLDYLSSSYQFNNINIEDGRYSLNLTQTPPCGSYPFTITAVDVSTGASDVQSGILYAVEIDTTFEYDSDIDVIATIVTVSDVTVTTTNYNASIGESFGVLFSFDIYFGGFDAQITLDITDPNEQVRYFNTSRNFSDQSDRFTFGRFTAIAPSDAGEYKCTLTVTDVFSGCATKTSLPLSVKSAIVNLGSDQQIIYGSTIQLGTGVADPNMQYQWDPAELVVNANAFPATITPIHTETTYTLVTTRTDVFNCIASDSVTITPLSPFSDISLSLGASVILPDTLFDIVCNFSVLCSLVDINASLTLNDTTVVLSDLANQAQSIGNSYYNLTFSGLTTHLVSDLVATVVLNASYFSLSDSIAVNVQPMIKIIPAQEQSDLNKNQIKGFDDGFFTMSYSAKNYNDTVHTAKVVLDGKTYVFEDQNNYFANIEVEVPGIINDYPATLTISTTNGRTTYSDTCQLQVHIVPEFMLLLQLTDSNNSGLSSLIQLVSMPDNQIGVQSLIKQQINFYEYNSQRNPSWQTVYAAFNYSDSSVPRNTNHLQGSDLSASDLNFVSSSDTSINVLFAPVIDSISDVLICFSNRIIQFYCYDNSSAVWTNLSDWICSDVNNVSSIILTTINNRNVLVVSQNKDSQIKFFEHTTGLSGSWNCLNDWTLNISACQSIVNVMSVSDVLGVLFITSDEQSLLKFYSQNSDNSWTDKNLDLPIEAGFNIGNFTVNNQIIVFYTNSDHGSTAFYKNITTGWQHLGPAWTWLTNQSTPAVGIQPLVINDNNYVAVPNTKIRAIDFYNYQEPKTRHILILDIEPLSKPIVQRGSDIGLLVKVINEGQFAETITISIGVRALGGSGSKQLPQISTNTLFVSDLAPQQVFSDTINLLNIPEGQFLCTASYTNVEGNVISTQTFVGGNS